MTKNEKNAREGTTQSPYPVRGQRARFPPPTDEEFLQRPERFPEVIIHVKK
jgi:hypothetical protein